MREREREREGEEVINLAFVLIFTINEIDSLPAVNLFLLLLPCHWFTEWANNLLLFHPTSFSIISTPPPYSFTSSFTSSFSPPLSPLLFQMIIRIVCWAVIISLFFALLYYVAVKLNPTEELIPYFLQNDDWHSHK